MLFSIHLLVSSVKIKNRFDMTFQILLMNSRWLCIKKEAITNQL